MMNNNYKNDFSCQYGETLIAVLYNEATASEKQEFENHVAACAGCREELVSFGVIKNVVTEWRKTEFDSFKTPSIILPNYQDTLFGQPKNIFWFEKLQTFLLPDNWQLSGATAFSGFAICALLLAIFGYALTNNFTDNYVASIFRHDPTVRGFESPKPTPVAVPARSPETDASPTKVNPAQTSINANNSKSAQSALKSEVRQAKSDAQQRPSVKRINNRVTRTITFSEPVDVEIETVEDLEDNSPRLSELLDDATPSM